MRSSESAASLRSIQHIIESRRAAISRLGREEERAHGTIIEYFRHHGRAPTGAELVRMLGTSEDSVAGILRRLDELDVIYLDPGTKEIASAYPFSNAPTPHLVAFLDEGGEERGRAYAVCAVDALGIPSMLGEAIRISSRCGSCGKGVSIGVRDGVKAPNGLVVWFGLRRSGHAATTACPSIQFYCSQEHLKRWRAEDHEEAGVALDLNEAMELARRIFGDMLHNRDEDL